MRISRQIGVRVATLALIGAVIVVPLFATASMRWSTSQLERPCRVDYLVSLLSLRTHLSTIARYCDAEREPRWVSPDVGYAQIFAQGTHGDAFVDLQPSYSNLWTTDIDLRSGRERERILAGACASAIGVNAGRLFLATGNSSHCEGDNLAIYVYRPPYDRSFAKLALHWPGRAIWFDRRKNVYIQENPYSIEAFDSRTLRRLREYPGGVHIIAPQAVVFDSDNRMIVANARGELCPPNGPTMSSGFLTIFKPDSTNIDQTINGVGCPIALAVDGGTLFVADAPGRRILVFRLADMHLIRQITDGVRTPVKLNVDTAGNLYALNGEWYSKQPMVPGVLSIYQRGASTPTATIPFGEQTPLDMLLLSHAR